MNNMTRAVMAGIILAAMTGGSGGARADDESCFTQRTSSGYVRICGESDGGYAFSIRDFGEERQRLVWRDENDEDEDHAPAVRTVVHHHYAPPARGHHKCKGRGHSHHNDVRHYYYVPVQASYVRGHGYWLYQ